MNEAETPRSIVLFDGACNLCHRGVQFIIARDPCRRFAFASLQSPLAQGLLARHGLAQDRPDSMVLIEGERASVRSTAALRIARELRWPWCWLRIFLLLPVTWRDPIYRWVAQNRYRWFGSPRACPLPDPETEGRFVG